MVWKGFRYVFRGLAVLLREHNFRMHLAMVLPLGGVGLWLKLPGLHWAWVALAWCLVLAAEAFNSAVEHLADALHPDEHPLVGRAKDIAAAAVFLAALGAAAVGLYVYGLPLWNLLFP